MPLAGDKNNLPHFRPDGTFRVMYETIGDNKDPQTLVDERKKAAITELEKQLAKIK